MYSLQTVHSNSQRKCQFYGLSIQRKWSRIACKNVGMPNRVQSKRWSKKQAKYYFEFSSANWKFWIDRGFGINWGFFINRGVGIEGGSRINSNYNRGLL